MTPFILSDGSVVSVGGSVMVNSAGSDGLFFRDNEYEVKAISVSSKEPTFTLANHNGVYKFFRSHLLYNGKLVIKRG